MEDFIKWYKQLNNRVKGLLKFLGFIILVGGLTALCITFLYAPMRINGDSMNPSLRNNDVVLIDKTAYNKEEPSRFDLVAFKYRYDYSQQYIKRVIGLPGETLYISDNKIYIKGKEDEEFELLPEYYGIYKGTKLLADIEPITLGKDQYFVLGDNRYDSDDSRSNGVGLVNKKTIIGKAVFRLFPFDGIGSLRYQ